MASSPTSVAADPVLDRLAQIQDICKMASVAYPASAAAPAAVELPDEVQDAVCALIGVAAGQYGALPQAAKNFNYEACFSEIRSSVLGLPYQREVEGAALLLEHARAARLMHAPCLAAVVQSYKNLIVRNKSFLDAAENVDDIISSLKGARAKAEAEVEQLRRANGNLLDEYTALGALHQQVKTDGVAVESRLNMRIGDLSQELAALRDENASLQAAKVRLTQDAADLCALLESRDGQVVNVDELRDVSEKDKAELIQLRRRVAELAEENADLAKKQEAGATEASAASLQAAARAADAEGRAARLEGELRSLRADLAAALDEKDGALSDYAQLAASTQRDHAAAADREHALRAEIQDMAAQLRALRDTTDLEAELRLSKETAEQLRADLAARTAELAAAKESSAKLEAELAGALGDLAEAQERASVLKQTLRAETAYAKTQEAQEESQISELTRRLREAEESGEAALREARHGALELTKTVQTLQARLKELSAGSSSVALREAYSSLDQTVDLPEVAAWLSKQMAEHPDAADGDEGGGERGALRSKILEIHASNENSMKSLRSEIKRLSKSQVSMERGLAEARELQQEYSDLCDVLKAEKAMLLRGTDAAAGGSESSQLVSSPAAARRGPAEDNSLDFAEPIVFVEIGNYECRVGLWDNEHGCFMRRYKCPAIVACPRNAGALPEDLVRGASLQSSGMYRSFRETGFFVGDDAQYCAFEHPDAALRGSLEVRAAVSGDGCIRDAAAYGALFRYCVAKAFAGLGEDADPSRFQAVFPFKSSFGDTEKMILGTLFFENEFPVAGGAGDGPVSAACEKVYVIPEPFLTALTARVASAVVVDIGSRSTHVIPVYEGVAINMSMRAALVGGEHCTDALERLVDAKGLSAYSSNLPRRRKQIARLLKEKHGFVAKSFEEAVAQYGPISLEAVRVMHGSPAEVPEALGRLLRTESGGTPKDRSAIAVTEIVKQPDGTAEEVLLDRELFYCTEVLFGEGSLSENEDPPEVETEATILDAILAATESIEDYDMRVEICETIVLTGGSARLPGLLERLQASDYLRQGLERSGVTSYSIQLAAGVEKPAAGETTAAASSSVLEGAQLRLAALHQGTERMDGGCVTAADYERVGSSCLDNLA